MDRNQIQTRIRFASLHLAISGLVLAAISTVVFICWYPNDLLEIQGGFFVLGMVVLVDLCLGPLLTFAVYDTKKRELLRDLIVVVLIQLAATSYGVWVLYSERPAYLAFVHDRFFVVRAGDLFGPAGEAEFGRVGYGFGPAVVAVNMTARTEMELAPEIENAAAVPLFAAMPAGYQAISDARSRLAHTGRSATGGKLPHSVIALLEGDPQLRAYPVVGRKSSGFVVLNHQYPLDSIRVIALN
ncbi:hypothetical protein OPU71_01975 [Niveibacterium sp. 24ML]|uniref:hypothetical protein n=1 Tax=Niveibacterium sp. 24ML TaxID=2985512 RepID=UPI002270A49A|nr:hypothetical protein [Niveibacterium sp. 24ML]MCX9154886.1 hypothetical protein [Niveibacterium sp. 24ML]